MYKIDLLRQIEANTRGGALSDCYSKYDLWRMIERNTRTEKPVLPPYQLANGLWDMSNRELVSFTRSTKAWLDGKEYAPDEPRYKNGELLVEGQATNVYLSDSMWQDVCDDLWTITKSTLGRYPVTSFESLNGRDYVYAYRWNGFSTTIDEVWYVTVTYQKDVDLLEFRDVSSRGMSPAFYVKDGLPDMSRPTLENCEVVSFTEKGDVVTVEVKVNVIKPNSMVILYGYFNKPKNSSFKMGIVQISDKPSSYIPTTTTAVTRAADIATVRDKS